MNTCLISLYLMNRREIGTDIITTPPLVITMEKEELFELAAEMASPDSGLEIKDRRYFLTTYRDVFVGEQRIHPLIAFVNAEY